MDAYVSRIAESTIIESAEMNLVRLFGLTPYPDGNMWCWLLGENLQSGVAGFGETPYLAALDFNKNFLGQKLPVKDTPHDQH
jgi:hypothetical protein